MTEEPFAFEIKDVILLHAGRGLHLAGTITAGVVRPGDSLQVFDADRAIGRVTVDAIEFADYRIGGSNPETLVALRVSGISAAEVAAGHHLQSIQHHVD
jgi:GTPase